MSLWWPMMIFVLFLSCNYIFFMSFFCFCFLCFFPLLIGLDWMGYVGLVWSYFWTDSLGLRSFITFMFMFMGYPKPICDFSGVVHFSQSGSVELCRYMSDESIFHYNLYIPSDFIVTLNDKSLTPSSNPPKRPRSFNQFHIRRCRRRHHTFQS